MTTPAPLPSLTDDDLSRLRDALAEAGYSVDGVRAVLGTRAAAALDRNETTPGVLAVTGSSALETLTTLWSLQALVTRAALDAAGLPVGALADGGFLAVAGDQARALIDIRPYADDAGDWWVAADLTPGLDGGRDTVPADHVLGLNAASSTLAQLTVRRPVQRALDLGTGCGVQSLHLSRHAEQVVATDVNRRALALADVTMRLNGLSVDLREGSLFDPVAAERFDLIATNPPFVVSPGGNHVYRDSGFAGDELTHRVVVDGAARLRPGGLLQSLGNWMHVRGEDWRDRVGGWAAETGCDAWVVQREVQDPAEYVELWLRDSGDVARPDYRQRYETWLRWFDDNAVEGVGFGWINLHAAGGGDPQVRVEDWPHAVAQPLGGAVAEWFDSAGSLRRLRDDSGLLAAHLTVGGGVVQEQIGPPGEEHPAHLVLRQQHGLLRAVEVGTAEAGFVGACDGSLSVGAIVDALATVLEADAAALRADLVPRIRDLVTTGFLELATE